MTAMKLLLVAISALPPRRGTENDDPCTAYLDALDAHRGNPSDEAKAALAEAKAALVRRLKATTRKRLDAIGCRFHLHQDGVRPGISVDRRLARSRDVAPPLLPRPWPPGDSPGRKASERRGRA